jgi:hypothetical protein
MSDFHSVREEYDIQFLEALDEYTVRRWFMQVELEQAEDTARAVQVIIETRRATQPKRKRRKDAGKPRNAENPPLIGTLGGME